MKLCQKKHNYRYQVLQPGSWQWVYCECEAGRFMYEVQRIVDTQYERAAAYETKYPKRRVAQYNGFSISDEIKAEKEQALIEACDSDFKDLMEAMETNHHERYE